MHRLLCTLSFARPHAVRCITRCTAPNRPRYKTDINANPDLPSARKKVKLHFIDGDENKTIIADVGDNLLDLAHKNGVDLEGACEASLACSTCHVILDDDHYNKLGEPSDEESDMLDLAFGLTETSRLGCQVIVDESLDGMTIKVPSITRNVQIEKLR